MQKEKRIWSQHEDNALRTLKQIRKIQKWSQIAKLLDQQFSIKGKNGKRCRQRYHNHISTNVKKQDWSIQEQNILIKLHNQKGNKWAEIAKILGRSDNAVKNHYHSRLRKGIRRINYRINSYFKYQHKPLKNNIISKIVQTAEQIYQTDDSDKKKIGQACFEIKNKILQQANEFDNFTTEQIDQLKRIVSQINTFNRTFRKKTKKIEKPYFFTQCKKMIFQNNSQQLSAENQHEEQQSQQDNRNCSNSNNQIDEISQPKAYKSYNFQNGTQTKKMCLRQQNPKKYDLRNARSRIRSHQVKNQQNEQIFIKSVQQRQQQNKNQCKTPSDFNQEQQGKQKVCIRVNQINYLSQSAFYIPWFNVAYCQPIIKSFNPFLQNTLPISYQINPIQPMSMYYLPSNSLITTIPTIYQAENKKNCTSSQRNNIILQQGFTLYNSQTKIDIEKNHQIN